MNKFIPMLAVAGVLAAGGTVALAALSTTTPETQLAAAASTSEPTPTASEGAPDQPEPDPRYTCYFPHGGLYSFVNCPVAETEHVAAVRDGDTVQFTLPETFVPLRDKGALWEMVPGDEHEKVIGGIGGNGWFDNAHVTLALPWKGSGNYSFHLVVWPDGDMHHAVDLTQTVFVGDAEG